MADMTRPGIIATKAVNQYRTRDSFAHFGLRQLLKSSVSRSDEWAKVIAVDQVIRRQESSYFVSEHFKDTDEQGINRFRKIVIPGPIELLAEAALLTECASHREFESHPSVFTYHLSNPSDRSGLFKHYMEGLKERHKEIERTLLARPHSVIRFLDLAKFYPSIRSKDVLAAWSKYSNVLALDYQLLGERLIKDHSNFAVDGSRGLLTGPMFSHFAANLVMREIDDWASSELGVRYMRYVDDIALIGDKQDVASATRKLAERLKSLELTMHDEASPKTIEVTAAEWLSGKSDFEHGFGDLTWGGFVSDVKSFLTLHPEKSSDLASSLANDGARFPVFSYASAVREAKYAESFYSRAKRVVFRSRAGSLTVDSLSDSSRKLRLAMESEVLPMLDQLPAATGFSRKRLVPKLRFRIGRLAYLSEHSMLQRFWEASVGVQELTLQREVVNATVTRDMSRVLALGPNAAQAAAQPLAASEGHIKLSDQNLGGVELQGAAAAVLSGLSIFDSCPSPVDGGILDLSRGVGVKQLKKSSSNFISEIAYLAGQDGSNDALISEAFDRDERLIFDAVERFEESAPRLV